MVNQPLGFNLEADVKSEAKEGAILTPDEVISQDGTVTPVTQPVATPEATEAVGETPEAVVETVTEPVVEKSKPEKKSVELKISIILQGTRILLGAKATDCDPKLETLEGDLSTVLLRLSGFVDECKQQWAESPRNPKTTIKEPTPPPPPPRTATTKSKHTAAPKSSEPTTQRMF